MSHPDRLPTGTVIGYGTAAPDHGPDGLYLYGPAGPKNPLARLIQSSKASTDPLPPHLAALVLTREARKEQRLRQMLARAKITTILAQLPAEQSARRRLPRLRCGRG
jgi:hypothetical protein